MLDLGGGGRENMQNIPNSHNICTFLGINLCEKKIFIITNLPAERPFFGIIIFKMIQYDGRCPDSNALTPFSKVLDHHKS